ncbi:hypothetical protein OG948_36365 (plasmid) [Embleya sp. NBC_00888]|uniref:hypothetical protein n=1 Tax=Embleya sp. NBC_00888 TaxID=2975960 RepID=UPI002F909EAE|nr:hypothetical protein OG948_36365 [Embleya sp. NBC_00888]
MSGDTSGAPEVDLQLLMTKFRDRTADSMRTHLHPTGEDVAALTAPGGVLVEGTVP